MRSIALGGGFVAREVVVALDVVVGPLDGVRGQGGFGFIKALLVTLEDPLRASGFKDERRGGRVLGVVGGYPALEREFPFGWVYANRAQRAPNALCAWKGRTIFSERQPWVRRFMEDTALPSGDVGPGLRLGFLDISSDGFFPAVSSWCMLLWIKCRGRWPQLEDERKGNALISRGFRLFRWHVNAASVPARGLAGGRFCRTKWRGVQVAFG